MGGLGVERRRRRRRGRERERERARGLAVRASICGLDEGARACSWPGRRPATERETRVGLRRRPGTPSDLALRLSAPSSPQPSSPSRASPSSSSISPLSPPPIRHSPSPPRPPIPRPKPVRHIASQMSPHTSSPPPTRPTPTARPAPPPQRAPSPPAPGRLRDRSPININRPATPLRTRPLRKT